MCGITGFWLDRPVGADDVRALDLMTDALAHRGPDGRGLWTDVRTGVGLGHRRLSIQDLSDAGAQPMVSKDRRHIISFNGEIYNAPEIKKALRQEGHEFHGHSDTEVLVEAIAAWGVEKAIMRSTGMFALAVWDNVERHLYLVRDRLGIKPLYWGVVGGHLVFASELKSLFHFPNFERTVDPVSALDFMRYGFVHGPKSILRNINKLSPGHILRYSGDGSPRIWRYWNLLDHVGSEHGAGRGDEDVAEQLNSLLAQSVREHLASDVPIGTFLSGGIDSSLITALAQDASAMPATSFTVGFEEKAYDEAAAARQVANSLGTNHVEVRASPDDALRLVADLPTWFDEPFADSSQLPSLLIAKLARERVTVILSGDGGDELFAGYSRYFWSQAFSSFPRSLRTLAGLTISGVARVTEVAPGLRESRTRLTRLSELMRLADAHQMHLNLLSVCRGRIANPDLVVQCSPESRPDTASLPAIRQMQVHDALTYLPDDILTKVDRASMSCGLEVRVPLLDHRIVEWSFALPVSRHVANGRGKALLRDVLGSRLPPNILERPKQGFGVPVGRWLDGPLRPWAEDLLSKQRLHAAGFFDPAAASELWRDHRSGRQNRQYELWMVLMLQHWSQHWRISL